MKRKTNEQFKKEVYDLVGDEYAFLDPYQGTHIKLKVKHNTCGHIYGVIPSAFLRGNRCPYCAGLAKKTNDQFKQEVYDLVGNEYEFLDTYVNARTKIRVKHNKCGHIYKVKPNAFLMGNRCPYCSINTKKADDRFKREVYDLVGNEYVFLDTYVTTILKLRLNIISVGTYTKCYLVIF